MTHHAASSLLLLFGIPIADSIGSVLPQTLGSTLSDPDDRPQVESSNQLSGAPDEKQEPGNFHIHTFYPALYCIHSLYHFFFIFLFLFERSLLSNEHSIMYLYIIMRTERSACESNE